MRTLLVLLPLPALLALTACDVVGPEPVSSPPFEIELGPTSVRVDSGYVVTIPGGIDHVTLFLHNTGRAGSYRVAFHGLPRGEPDDPTYGSSPEIEAGGGTQQSAEFAVHTGAATTVIDRVVVFSRDGESKQWHRSDERRLR
jgi:hypothetical protein